MAVALTVGELRPSQLLHAFGVGATVDLPQLSVVVLGLHAWNRDDCAIVTEERVLAAVRERLGDQVESLRAAPLPETEPDGPFDPKAGIGVPVGPFPRWLRCPACQLLAPIETGLFSLKDDRYRHDRTRYVHANCPKGCSPSALPVRFVLACEAGHLDDFDWMGFVHGGPQGAGAHVLRLIEPGLTGEAGDVFVQCGCGKSRPMLDAFGEGAADVLRSCRGRHPHLARRLPGCDSPQRTMLLGASNAWFPLSVPGLSLPVQGGGLDQRIEEHWGKLEKARSADGLQTLADVVPELAWIHEHDLAEVWAAVVGRREGTGAPGGPVDLRGPEYRLLADPDGAPSSDDFRLRRARVPREVEGRVAGVVQVERLREVQALCGFTRIESLDPDEPRRDRVAPLTRDDPTWVPCAEVRGEGIFVRLPEERVAQWEERYRASDRWAAVRDAHHRWRVARAMDPATGLQPARFVLLHTLAHALMRELALECGYGATSIRERVYAADPAADNGPMAGVLLYTAAPDSEGTLGGLVELGAPENLGRLLRQALEHARLCSSDPLCSEHDPRDSGTVHLAACHACAFAAETSCERGNRFLDRAALMPTFSSDAALAYFA